MKLIVAVMSMMVFGAGPMMFQGKTYQLGAFSHQTNAMWEFVSAPETVNNWTTLLTVVDRPDAKTAADLDRLAQGVLNTYTGRGGKVVMARTMRDAAGKPFNYMVVAFDEPGKKRYELNFVKAALGAKNAYIVIYGARVTDAKDYVGKAKAFLSARSGEIGMELEKMSAPAVEALPRQKF